MATGPEGFLESLVVSWLQPIARLPSLTKPCFTLLHGGIRKYYHEPACHSSELSKKMDTLIYYGVLFFFPVGRIDYGMASINSIFESDQKSIVVMKLYEGS